MTLSPLSILNAVRRDGYAIVGLLVLTALLLSPYLFASPTPYIFPASNLGTDLTREVLPPIYYVLDVLHRTGELPLWRTYLLSGAPLIGHPVIPALYPPHWLVLVLPVPLALVVDILLHLWWLAVGTYLCLRFLSLVRWEAALTGGLLFAHAPLFVAHVTGGHWSTISAIAWFPWMWLSFHKYWHTRKLSWAVLLGVGLAAQALNDGKYLFICALCLAACTLGYIRFNLGWLRSVILGWGLALVVLVGLAAGQLLPLAELLSQSNRSNLNYAEAAGGAPLALFLIGTFLPYNVKLTELFVFPGVGTLLLALYGAAAGVPKRLQWWALGIVLVTLISTGSNTPIYGLLFNFVPGFKGFRGPERWFPIALFGIVMFAAWGLDRWLGQYPTTKWAKPLVVGIALAYCLVAGFQLTTPATLPFHVSTHFIAALIIAGLLISGWSLTSRKRLAFALVFLFATGSAWWEDFNLGYPQSVTAYNAPDEVTVFLKSATTTGQRIFLPYGGLSDTVLVLSGLPTADGWDPTQLSTYTEFIRRSSGCNTTEYSVGAPPTRGNATALEACPEFRPNLSFLKLLNVRYVVLPTSVPNQAPALKPVFSASGKQVYDTGGWLWTCIWCAVCFHSNASELLGSAYQDR